MERISHDYTIYSCGLFVVLWYHELAVLWYQKNPFLVLTWEKRSSTIVTDVENKGLQKKSIYHIIPIMW